MLRFYQLLGLLTLTKTATAHANDKHECETFFEHTSIIASAAGTLDPRKVTGYSRLVCKQIFATFQHKAPNALGHVENLARHLQVNGVHSKLASHDTVYDLRKLLPDPDCEDFDFGQGNPGPGSTASAIRLCQDIPDLKETCPHVPCVPEYLKTDNTETMTTTYAEFSPDYPSGASYEAFTFLLQAANIWSGCNRDRTSAGPVGTLLITIIALTNAVLIADVLCQAAAGDDVELVIPCTTIAIDLPNPGRVVCAAIVGVAKAALLAFETLYEQVGYQDGVDGSEIEAAYEHSRNLMTKQCAIFDQAVCRCSELPLGYGHGCDGVDSNCNDLIDECDEDVVPPEIDVSNTLGLCGSSHIWFKTNEDAEKCVDATVGVHDDCQTVTYEVGYTEGNCSNTIIGIEAEDACTRDSSALVTVQVDGEKPTVECAFGDVTDVNVTFTGSGVLKNTNFYYAASDACGLPLNVTVDMYANEIEDFNNQEMALFYQTEGQENSKVGLFVARGICSTESNGQCIKDDNAYDARRYTAVVSATDVAGNSDSTECTFTILPKGNLNKKDVDFGDSTQRFLLTSHTSIFDTYN